jgi:hypothetical protein
MYACPGAGNVTAAGNSIYSAWSYPFTGISQSDGAVIARFPATEVFTRANRFANVVATAQGQGAIVSTYVGFSTTPPSTDLTSFTDDGTTFQTGTRCDMGTFFVDGLRIVPAPNGTIVFFDRSGNAWHAMVPA